MGKDKEKKSKHRKEKKSKSHKHKSHKHKKHKASKDEERASVSSSSSSSSRSSSSSHADDASSVSGSQADDSQLAALLSQACSQFAQLIEEFPALLAALDADQGIQLHQLENPAIRSALEEIFLSLPLEMVEEDGVTEFYKSSAVDSVGKWLSAHLLARGIVALPDAMSTPQLLATQGAIQVQTLLKEFPEIREDVIAVLETIHQGSFVQIDSLENERVKELLKELFEALSLDYVPPKEEGESGEEAGQQEETGYGLKDMEGEAALGLEWLLRPLTTAASLETEGETANEAAETAASEAGVEAPRRPAVVGPAMPTREQLAQAQVAAADYMQKYIGVGQEDDDEDDFGPSLATPAQQTAIQKAAAASAGPELLGMIGAELPSAAPAASVDTAAAVEAPRRGAAPKHGHEEWMMTPGDSKLLGGLKSTLPTTRTFQRGKTAKALEEERKRKAPQMSEEEQKRMEEVLAEHRAKRGKSLVELHQEQRRAKAASGAFRNQDRRPFDREKDLTTRKMNESQVRDLVARARDFDTRFSKSVQRTFL